MELYIIGNYYMQLIYIDLNIDIGVDSSIWR